jgi:homoserine kinase
LRVAHQYHKETLPPVELEIHNQIPLGKGLGSSAAALTAGVVIADKLLGLGWKPLRILDEAAQIEGHPDNVAAAVLGSVVASAIDSHGATRAVRIEFPERYGVAVVVPDFVLPTVESRSVLPSFYSRADTVFNIQRAALLIAALATGSTSAFPAALEDRLHQPHRMKLVPGLEEVIRMRAPGLLGCALSGAGPSILVFYEKGCESVCDLVVQIFEMHGHKAEVMWTRADMTGLQVRSE